MKIKFTTLVLATAALATAALTINTANAEATKVNVPFSFKVAGKVLPAGEYSVERDHNGNFIKLQGKDPAQLVIVVASAMAADGKLISLKFDTQNNEHVLQTIQYGHLISSRLDKGSKTHEDVSPQYIPSR
jgi:hypothetical protein